MVCKVWLIVKVPKRDNSIFTSRCHQTFAVIGLDFTTWVCNIVNTTAMLVQNCQWPQWLPGEDSQTTIPTSSCKYFWIWPWCDNSNTLVFNRQHSFEIQSGFFNIKNLIKKNRILMFTSLFLWKRIYFLKIVCSNSKIIIVSNIHAPLRCPAN